MSNAWQDRACADAAEVVSALKSGMKVYVHGAAAAPTQLLQALSERTDLEGLELYHIHLDGPAPFAAPELAGHLHSNSLFTGPNLRTAVAEGRADFIPVFLSDIPDLFTCGRVKLDAALVSLAPADRHGFCSLGPSVEAALDAVKQAPLVLAQVNAQMPRTHGDSFWHIDKVSRFLMTDTPLHTHPAAAIGPVEQAIGNQIAAMIDHGSTLQLGIGAIPAAVVSQLGDKIDLGVHTEMFSDGVVELMQAGVITNRRKTLHQGHSVTSFVTGTRRVFDFVDDNPAVEFYSCDYTNDTSVIRAHDNMIAVNSALEIDLTGQVCADSIGPQIFSGIGGQMDFIRGAARSRGGKPIIAIPSTARGGTLSRLVTTLKPGAGVVTTRGHVHWVVTEYGAVNLHGLTLRQRGEALISIAHPDFRPQLTRELRELRHFTA